MYVHMHNMYIRSIESSKQASVDIRSIKTHRSCKLWAVYKGIGIDADSKLTEVTNVKLLNLSDIITRSLVAWSTELPMNRIS